MADAGDGAISGATESLDDVANQVDLLKQSSVDFLSTANNYINAAEKLANIPGWDGASAEQMNKALKDSTKHIEDMTNASGKAGKGAHTDSSSWEKSYAKAGYSAQWVKEQFNSLFTDTGKHAQDFSKQLLDGADAAGALMAVSGYETLVGKFDKISESMTGLKAISDVQKPLLETRRIAIQTGLGFGQSFKKASSDMQAFHTAMGRAQIETRSTMEEMRGVQGTLKEAFAPEAMIANLDALVGANKNFETSVNLTSTALLVARAKGMSHAETAGMMAKAHLELGETAESVPRIFAQMADALEGSGLQFSAGSKHLMKFAGDLKMWGGTVGSVTPIFKSFSRALGEGQKGLVPELVEQYVSGIKSMSFEMRALIGMQAGGAGGAGAPSAIGGAIKQEMLMEQGEEGMAELSGNLIDSIKKMTGGELLTREEAAENPAVEQRWLLQRQLLQQQLKIGSDSANKMMGALQKIDEGGMSVGKDQAKTMSDLLKSGEDAGKATTDAMVQATIDVQGAVETQGGKLLDVVEKLISKMQPVKATRRALRGMAKGDTGLMGGAQNLMKDLGSGDMFKELVEAISGKTGRGISSEKEVASVKEGQKSGMKEVSDAMERLAAKRDKDIAGDGEKGGFGLTERQRTRAGLGQEVGGGQVRDDIKKEVKALNQTIAALREKRKEGKLGNEGESKLRTMVRGRNQLKQLSQQKKINLADFGKAGDGGEEKELSGVERADAFAKRARARALEGRKLYGPKKATPEGKEDIQQKMTELTETGERIPTQKMKVAKPQDRVDMAQVQRAGLPMREAQQATSAAQQKKMEIRLDESKIEKEVVFKIMPDKSSVTIQLDEQELKEKIGVILDEEADKR